MNRVFLRFDRCSFSPGRRTSIAVLLTVLIFGCSSAFAQTEDSTQAAIEQFNFGQDAHQKGDLAAAVERYKKALELLPEFPEAELQLGNAYLSLKRFDDAERSFRRACELRADWSLAMASLGSLLVSENNYTEALPLLTGSLEQDEANPLALSALAELRLKTNADNSVLKDLLNKVTELAGKVRPTPGLLTAKAALEYKLDLIPAGKESVRRALEAEPGSAVALGLAAEIALRQSDAASADLFVKKLESLEPGGERTLLLRARVLAESGKREEAIRSLEPIAETSIAAKRFIAELSESDTTDLADLESILRADPSDVRALSGLCTGYRLKDAVKALDYCRRASIAEPNEISHAINFGAALVQAKRYSEAVDLLRRLLTAAPEHATIRANLATALFQLKRFDEARAEFLWLTLNQPKSPVAFYFLGITFDQLGRYMDAMANYQQFLKLADPEANKLEIEKVNLRLPAVQRLIKNGKGKKGE